MVDNKGDFYTEVPLSQIKTQTVADNKIEPTVPIQPAQEQVATLITNPEDAHEIANLVVTKGTTTAEAREKELAEGLTQTQKENLSAINGLPTKYPDAFAGGGVQYNQKGKPYLITKKFPDHGNALITQDGVAFLCTRNTNPFNSYPDSHPVLIEEATNLDDFGNIDPIDLAGKDPISLTYKTKDGKNNSYRVTGWGATTGDCPPVREAATTGLKTLLESIQRIHVNDPKPQAQPSNVMDLF